MPHLENPGRHGLGVQKPDLPSVVPPAPHQALAKVDEDGQADPHPGVAHQPLMVFIGDCWAGVKYEGHIEDDEEVMRACT